MAGIGAAGALLATQFVNVPALIENTTKTLQDFNAAVGDQLALANKISSIGDAQINRRFKDQLRAIQLQRAANNEQEVAVVRGITSNQKRLDNERNTLRAIEDRTKQSLRVRESLQERLNRLVNQGQDDQTSRLPIGRQITETLSQAGRAQDSGDLDRAEQLIDRARELAQQAGGHSFFTRQVDSQSNRLIEAVQRSLREQGKEVEANQKRAQSSRSVVKQLQDEINKYKKAKYRMIDLEDEKIAAEHAKNEINFTRKAALENAIVLLGQNYFAGPSVPRDLYSEAAKRREASERVDKKIGNKMKRRKKRSK